MNYNIDDRKKDTGIVNLTDYLNVIDFYEDGEIEKALELSIGLMTLGLGGSFEASDREVKRLLRNREYTAVKDNERYLNKVESNNEAKKAKLQLEQIAEMLSCGATQQTIADTLGVSLDTIKYRIRVMKEKFPTLYIESVKKCKKSGVSVSNDNDNDNDNGNVNVNSTTHTSKYGLEF